MKKNSIKSIVLLILIILVAVGVGYKLAKNENQSIHNNGSNETIIEKIQDETSKNEGDEVKPKDIQNIDISIENQIYSVAVLEDFSDGNNLSTEQYLKVVHESIANGYINLPNVIEKKEISEELVNSIVYKIFGVELKENKSIDGMEYKDGVYKIETKRSGFIFLIQDKTTDSAAGTAYTKFKLFKEFASGKEDYLGEYEILMVHNTVTGEPYIKSFKKIK